MKTDTALQEHLLYLLRDGGAHLNLDQALKGLPPGLRGVKIAGMPHTLWQLIEHMRIAQWDILEYSRKPGQVSPAFPEGYWPPTEAPPDEAAWNASIAAFKADLQAMEELVLNPSTDLFAVISKSDNHTILREAMMVADHNAYHLGQIVLARRLLGTWAGS